MPGQVHLGRLDHRGPFTFPSVREPGAGGLAATGKELFPETESQPVVCRLTLASGRVSVSPLVNI